MSRFDIFQFAQRNPMLFAGLAFWIYAAIACVAVQLIVLPHALPGIHAGHGLLAGGDFPGLHEIAARLASRISHQGWSAWEAYPEGQSPAGLAGAIYALTYPEPWVLIPINATMHALGGAIIMRLIQILTDDALIAFWGGALYVVFPSSLHWVSQIQKDSTYFLGMLAVLLGFITLIRSATIKSNLAIICGAIALFLVGFLLTATVRLYGFELIAVAAAAVAIVVTPSLIRGWRQHGVSAKGLVLVLCIMASVMVLAGNAHRDKRFDGEWQNTQSLTSNEVSNVDLQSVDQTKNENALSIAQRWQLTELLPKWLDRIFMRIGVARFGWAGPSYATAGSMIDMNVQFLNARQVIEYLPRAMQIAFLAPFPKDWLAQGSSPGGSIMRRVTGIEMLVLYPLLLLGLPLAAWRWKRKLEFWVIIVFCVTILTTYAYVIPNLGTLYRIRYGFLMPLAAVGLSAIWLSLKQLRNRNMTPLPL